MKKIVLHLLLASFWGGACLLEAAQGFSPQSLFQPLSTGEELECDRESEENDAHVQRALSTPQEENIIVRFGDAVLSNSWSAAVSEDFKATENVEWQIICHRSPQRDSNATLLHLAVEANNYLAFIDILQVLMKAPEGWRQSLLTSKDYPLGGETPYSGGDAAERRTPYATVEGETPYARAVEKGFLHMALLLDEAWRPEEQRLTNFLSNRLVTHTWNESTANFFNSIPYKEWLLLLPWNTSAGEQTLLHLAIENKALGAVKDMIEAARMLPEDLHTSLLEKAYELALDKASASIITLMAAATGRMIEDA